MIYNSYGRLHLHELYAELWEKVYSLLPLCWLFDTSIPYYYRPRTLGSICVCVCVSVRLCVCVCI